MFSEDSNTPAEGHPREDEGQEAGPVGRSGSITASSPGVTQILREGFPLPQESPPSQIPL